MHISFAFSIVEALIKKAEACKVLSGIIDLAFYLGTVLSPEA